MRLGYVRQANTYIFALLVEAGTARTFGNIGLVTRVSSGGSDHVLRTADAAWTLEGDRHSLGALWERRGRGGGVCSALTRAGAQGESWCLILIVGSRSKLA
jgi:hypothetical protein